MEDSIATIPVILAGGNSTRMAPLGVMTYPKQFLPLLHPELSLFQQAASRGLKLFPGSRVVTVVQRSHAEIARTQLRALSRTRTRHILVEPQARNTAAAIALAAAYIREVFGDATMVILPADHYIGSDADFAANLEDACALARRFGHIVTFGARPAEPSSDYGYIEAGGASSASLSSMPIRRFIEKPTREIAETLILQGNCYINCGIFVARASVLLKSLQAYFEHRPKHVAGSRNGEDWLNYAKIPALPFDKAVMERTALGRVTPADFDWADVGAWKRLWACRSVLFPGAERSLAFPKMPQSERADSRPAADAPIRVLETADKIVISAGLAPGEQAGPKAKAGLTAAPVS